MSRFGIVHEDAAYKISPASHFSNMNHSLSSLKEGTYGNEWGTTIGLIKEHTNTRSLDYNSQELQ